MSGDHCDLTADKIALVLGNERDGITDAVHTRAHRFIHIPMLGMVQSLNLSVTAAILLYEITRQRGDTDRAFNLSDAEQQALVDFYVQREVARILRKPGYRISQPEKQK